MLFGMRARISKKDTGRLNPSVVLALLALLIQTAIARSPSSNNESYEAQQHSSAAADFVGGRRGQARWAYIFERDLHLLRSPRIDVSSIPRYNLLIGKRSD